jgi:hypothetical protein
MGTIINTLNSQLEELATETIVNMLTECPLEELQELDCINCGDYVQDLLDANNCYYESFYYFDTYYAETAGRGDSGQVCEEVRDALEMEFGDYIYEEAEEFKTLEGVQRANWFVNLYAECACTNFIPADVWPLVEQARKELEEYNA